MSGGYICEAQEGDELVYAVFEFPVHVGPYSEAEKEFLRYAKMDNLSPEQIAYASALIGR